LWELKVLPLLVELGEEDAPGPDTNAFEDHVNELRVAVVEKRQKAKTKEAQTLSCGERKKEELKTIARILLEGQVDCSEYGFLR